MKYTKKVPKTDPLLSDKLLEEGWIKIKEPPNLPLAVLFSLPFVYLLLIVTLWLGYLLKPGLFSLITFDSFEISFTLDIKRLLFIIAIFGYMFLHEIIHAVLIPNFENRKKPFGD